MQENSIITSCENTPNNVSLDTQGSYQFPFLWNEESTQKRRCLGEHKPRTQKHKTTLFCLNYFVAPTGPRRRRKNPNVYLLPRVLTSSLRPLAPSAPPVLAAHPVSVAQPAGATLQPALQRQPQRLQPHQLPGLFPWRVLPAPDRTHQGDGQPGGGGRVAVRRQGPGVLHRRPEGTLSSGSGGRCLCGRCVESRGGRQRHFEGVSGDRGNAVLSVFFICVAS